MKNLRGQFSALLIVKRSSLTNSVETIVNPKLKSILVDDIRIYLLDKFNYNIHSIKF